MKTTNRLRNILKAFNLKPAQISPTLGYPEGHGCFEIGEEFPAIPKGFFVFDVRTPVGFGALNSQKTPALKAYSSEVVNEVLGTRDIISRLSSDCLLGMTDELTAKVAECLKDWKAELPKACGIVICNYAVVLVGR